MDLADVAVLTGPLGADLIAQAGRGLDGEGELRTLERLGATHGAGAAAAAVSQAVLRRRAVAKFGSDAERLLFTRPGLEQATRTRVAAWRAAELAGALHRAGLALSVTDLGCGLGADLIAFARAGLSATGLEIDPVTAALAQANVDALGLAAPIRCGDATAPEAVDPAATAFLDPSRRDGAGRVWSARGWAPPWSFVQSLLEGEPGDSTGSIPAATVVKAGPAIPHPLVPRGVAPDWVSEDGDVVEACLWSRALHERPEGVHRAVLLGSAGPPGLPTGPRILDGDPSHRAPVGPVAAYLHEPDGAVIRAGLVGELADRIGGHAPADGIGYLFTEQQQPSEFATTYRVEAELPHRTRALRQELRRLGVGALTIKARGVRLDPDSLRRELLAGAQRGGEDATVVFCRTAAQRTTALLVRREPGLLGKGTKG
jgi:SAM-dependent methyltransferase